MSESRVCVAKIVSETDDALCIELNGGRVLWLPWSHISQVHRTENPWVKIASWLAEKENLI